MNKKQFVSVFFMVITLAFHQNVTAAEKPKQQSEPQAITSLGVLLEEATAKASAVPSPTPTEPLGACAYVAGSKVYCNNLSKSNCDRLNGTWTSGGKCP